MPVRRFVAMLAKPAIASLVAIALAVTATPAAAVEDGPKCESSKVKVAGVYARCVLKAEAKGVKKGRPSDIGSCVSDYAKNWNKIEDDLGPACPTEGDEGSVRALLDAQTGLTTFLLAGVTTTSTTSTTVPGPRCGDGTLDAGTFERCEVGDLDGQTCTTRGFVGGELACGTGCVFDDSGCYLVRFVDNGDGTTTDHETGLVWERKDGADGTPDATNLHDVDNTYTWAAATADWISEVNGLSADGVSQTGLAGRSDWRVPTVLELASIVDEGTGSCGGGSGACIDAAFGPTQPDEYWTGTAFPGLPTFAWFTDFSDGSNLINSKTKASAVRAVRGGD